MLITDAERISELERHLAIALQFTTMSTIKHVESLHHENAQLRERIKELEKDKARLDWFNKYIMSDNFDADFLDNLTGSTYACIRQAIDSAMQTDKEGGK